MSLNRGRTTSAAVSTYGGPIVYHENYNNSGGNISFTRAFTRSTLNSTNELEGNGFASFLLGAPSGGSCGRQPHASLRVVLRGAVDPGRLADQQQADPQPRLPLGRQWLGDGGGQHAELRVRSDDRQSGVGARRSAGDGRPHVRRRRRRPGQAWKIDKDNYQARVGTAYSLNEKTVLRAGWGKYFLNPTSQGFNNGFSQSTTSLRRPTATARRPTRCRTRGRTAFRPRLAALWARMTFLGRGPSFSNPDFIVPNVAPVLRRRPARAAVADFARRDLRRQPEL